MLGSVSEHQSHWEATTPLFRFAHLVEIEESATGHAILPNHFSPLSWWDKTYVLQILLIYHDGMKLMNTLCLCHLICYWCLAMKAKPNERHFFADIFIKQWFCSIKLSWIYCMLSVYWLQFMISHAPLLGFEFHIQVDFGFNDLFSHIFSFLYHNSVETSWFSLMRHEKLLTKEKCMQSSMDTTISMLSPTKSSQSAFAL